MKRLVIAGIWTGAMLLWAASYVGYSDFRLLGIVYPIGLWLIGMLLIVVAGLISWLRRRRRSRLPTPTPVP